MPQKEFKTVKEVADYLDISERSVYRYIKGKKLKALKIGSWRISITDLQEFIRGSTNIHDAERS